MKLLLIVLIFWLAMPITAFAEDGCSGPTYAEPTCGGAGVNCPQTDCHDVSFNQDGTLFQCCPPTSVPEFPGWVNPFYLALLLSLGFWAWNSQKAKAGIVLRRVQ